MAEHAADEDCTTEQDPSSRLRNPNEQVTDAATLMANEEKDERRI